MLKWLIGPSDLDRKAEKLYGAVVAGARNRAFYADLGVPDTPEGRFELVVLHLFLVLERLNGGEGGEKSDAGRPLTQRTIEAFVTDMDDCMREMGVGDLVVPKKVKRAAAAFYERAGAYRVALAASGNADLERAVAAAFAETGTSVSGQVAATAIASYIRSAHEDLAHLPAESVADASLTFPSVSR